ncbi:MAG: hydantoinase/oxoprolinase family protein [Chloroflexota bacterium]
MSSASLLIGIDIGGTFTDFILYEPGAQRLQSFKRLSTPDDPARAVLEGLAQVFGDHPGAAVRIVHGSTVATNALLERKGARTAFIATRGFSDILQIGRQNRPELYDWSAAPPEPLAPEELRFEVDERVDSHGQALQSLDPAQVQALIPALQAVGAQAAAVCLLFSFLRPEHEALIAARLREAGLLVSVSSEVLPEFREYERASTTTVNAYVSPVLDRYLARLEQGLGGAGGPGLAVMQSNGGVIRVAEARRAGVRCILSGPAGGVIGAGQIARQRYVTFDMGGTSTDVSLVDGEPQLTHEAVVGGCPIHIPLLDIHTIGAGGGSIARLDPGGALRVGPGSAGADPGPACYGRGELPTVTDANLVLGYLLPERFLGGAMALDAGRAWAALGRLGAAMGVGAEQAALGVTAVVNAHMERALRLISVERGHDPRRFDLVSFGGAGGLHAAALRRALGLRRVIVPALASTLSAFGMLAAETARDYSQTIMLPDSCLDGGPPQALLPLLQPLLQQAHADLLAEGVLADEITCSPALDMRCRGQSYELRVPFDPGEAGTALLERFHAAHQRAYGYARPGAPVELVTLRLRAAGAAHPPRLAQLAQGGPDPAGACFERRRLLFPEGRLETPLYQGEALHAGAIITGPALVVRADTSVLLGPADQARVDLYGSLLISDWTEEPVYDG